MEVKSNKENIKYITMSKNRKNSKVKILIKIRNRYRPCQNVKKKKIRTSK